jgi:hypothetical protein
VDSLRARALAGSSADKSNWFLVTTNLHEMVPAVLERGQFPPVGLGLTSVILGAIGVVLFVVPVIGIPISVAGLLVGTMGIVVVFLGGTASLRLSVAGIVLSGCGLAIIWAIALAPGGYFRPRAVFPSLPPSIERPYVPPPAAPQMAWNSGLFSSAPIT